MLRHRGYCAIRKFLIIYHTKRKVVLVNWLGRFRVGERITVVLTGISVVLFLGMCLLRLG